MMADMKVTAIIFYVSIKTIINKRKSGNYLVTKPAKRLPEKPKVQAALSFLYNDQ